MVRSQRPLVEKLTLFWHDHFATADQDTPLMLAQNQKLRRGALGSFRSLLREITRDPAMQLLFPLVRVGEREEQLHRRGEPAQGDPEGPGDVAVPAGRRVGP